MDMHTWSNYIHTGIPHPFCHSKTHMCFKLGSNILPICENKTLCGHYWLATHIRILPILHRQMPSTVLEILTAPTWTYIPMDWYTSIYCIYTHLLHYILYTQLHHQVLHCRSPSLHVLTCFTCTPSTNIQQLSIVRHSQMHSSVPMATPWPSWCDNKIC